jgi:hypothetical protein
LQHLQPEFGRLRIDNEGVCNVVVAAAPDGERHLPGWNGRFPFNRLVKFYNFTEINRAIADSKRGHTVKPVRLMNQ